MRAPLRRLTATLAALVAIGCGSQSAPDQSRPAGPPTAAIGWTTDPTGQVACSAGRLPAQGQQARLEARLGGFTAVLTGVVRRAPGPPTLGRPRLTLTSPGRAVTVALRAPRIVPGGSAGYSPGPIGLGDHVNGYLCLARFGSAPPVALSDYYSGGAHCCTTVQVVDGSGRQSRLRTGNVVPSLRLVDGQLVLASGDDRFNYAFADFADSCAPVSLLLPHDGGFRDVTREHPAALRADARRAWRYVQQRSIRTGFLACWAADEERLGADARVWRTLDALGRQGKLRLPRDLTAPGWWKDGTAYVAQLRHFLTGRGYRAG